MFCELNQFVYQSENCLPAVARPEPRPPHMFWAVGWTLGKPPPHSAAARCCWLSIDCNVSMTFRNVSLTSIAPDFVRATSMPNCLMLVSRS